MTHKIKETRMQKKLSQRKLASLSNIPQGTLSDIENYKKIPTRVELEKIAKTLDVTVEFLTGESPVITKRLDD